jgi:alpha-tubulin suppressor-like RCC1 family protein
LGHGDKSDQPLPRKIQINQKIQKISCGGAHAALLTAQGKLFMMGRGREGQLGRFFNNEGNTGNSFKIEPVEQLPNNKKISQMSCGGTHTLVLLEDL